MKAHGTTPMKKNFGIGDSEMPIKTASPGKSKDHAADSPTKDGSPLFKGGGGGGGGFFSKIKSKLAAAKAKKMGGVAEATAGVANDPAAAGAEAMAADPAGQGGGGVAPHGPEAHSGGGGAMGGMMKKPKMFGSNAAGGGMMGGLFSDSRLKEKIQRTGASPSGIPIYEFNYIGDNSRYSGTMAQDLLESNPDAVSVDTSGYYKVNYNNIDVDMHQLN